MILNKPDKIREEMYDKVVEGLKEQGMEPFGRNKEGLVYENHVDGEHVVIKVIKKKTMIPEEEVAEVITYEEKLKMYEDKKAEKKKEAKKDDGEDEGEDEEKEGKGEFAA